MYAFLSGAVAFGFTIATLFFFRFWKRSGDGLFYWFGIAFLLLAVGQTLLTLLDVTSEERSWLFLLRLAAFSIIIAAILRKNRPAA
jgi:uncharacterized membrane protein HdeD (DUF308 family)